MSRYRGPKLRIVRRLGKLPGLTRKKSIKRKTPGQHGREQKDPSVKKTEYGIRLEEKQKLKFNYGLTESQLYKYIKEARRRKGVTGLILIQLLEMRLDTICFNLGFATSIAHARQLVNHGHIIVNQKSVNIPSFQCHVNDLISIKQKPKIISLIKENLNKNYHAPIPSHLTLDNSKPEGKILDFCDRKELLLELDELLVIEYYSQR